MLRSIQILNVIMSMILPTLIVGWMIARRPLHEIGFRTSTQARQVVLVLGIVIVSVMVAGALGAINKNLNLFPDWKTEFEQLEKNYAEQVSVMINLKSFGGYLFSLLLMAVLPAIGEEMLFRGGLQNFLSKATRQPWLAILIVSVLFSLIHFSFFGFLPRLFLGIVLGTIFYLTNNLWLSVFAHFLNNAFAVTAMYVYVQRGKGVQEAMSDEMVSYWALLFIPALIFLFMQLRKVTPADAAAQPFVSQNSYNHGAERTDL
jgi:membrane protease YdiL (CAAX protease family)